MKKWRIILAVSTSLLIIFLMYISYVAIGIYKADKIYPNHDFMGITINNWFEEFLFVLGMIFPVLGIILIIDIILIVISIIKLKKIE